MRLKKALAIILLSFLASMVIVGFVCAEDSHQEYVEIEIGDTIERETAYVVAPHIIITVPRSHDILLITEDGIYKGEDVWWFSYNVMDSVKCYISYNPLEISQDIPERIRKTYESLKPRIEDLGGIDAIINDEIEEDKERAIA
jgi:hypothetical protein